MFVIFGSTSDLSAKSELSLEMDIVEHYVSRTSWYVVSGYILSTE